MSEGYPKRILSGSTVLVCVLLLSCIAVFNQVKAKGLGWQEEHYKAALDAVATGQASAPEQYRVLSAYATVWACRLMELAGIPRPVGTGLVAIRVIQNVIIFLLALAYYRRLGIPVYLGLLGVSALTWGMTLCTYESGLAIDVYTEIILYLWAGLVIVEGKPGWIVLITLLGALNRETSALIPFLLLAAGERKGGVKGASSLAVYGAVFAALRLHYRGAEWIPEASAAPWVNLVGVLGVMPVLAALSAQIWPRTLRAAGWVIVPAWFAAHALFGGVAETRVLLLPQVMVFIPGALWSVMHVRELSIESEGPVRAT